MLKKCALAIVCAISLPLQAAEPATTAASTLAPLAENFSAYFSREMRERNVPGGVVAVVERDRIVRVEPFGARQQGKPGAIDAHTVFRIASASKSFAGVLSSMLVREGHFSFQDKVVQHVPDFSFKSAKHTQALKVEHLLAQSTGVGPNAFDDLIEINWTADRILPKFKEIDPNCAPGKCYGYQNVLFSLIQPVIEKTTKKSYPQLLNERIFKPLGMPTASVGMEAYLGNPNHAFPHLRISRTQYKPGSIKQTYYNFAPAAGVNASATDLSYWLMAQMGHFPQVIAPEVVQEVSTERVKTWKDLHRRIWSDNLDDAHYGLGWRVYEYAGEKLVYHGGWVSGFRSDMSYSPERGVGLVILMNAESELVAELSAWFWTSLMMDETRADKLIAKYTSPNAPTKKAVAGSAKKAPAKKTTTKKANSKKTQKVASR